MRKSFCLIATLVCSAAQAAEYTWVDACQTSVLHSPPLLTRSEKATLPHWPLPAYCEELGCGTPPIALRAWEREMAKCEFPLPRPKPIIDPQRLTDWGGLTGGAAVDAKPVKTVKVKP